MKLPHKILLFLFSFLFFLFIFKDSLVSYGMNNPYFSKVITPIFFMYSEEDIKKQRLVFKVLNANNHILLEQLFKFKIISESYRDINYTPILITAAELKRWNIVKNIISKSTNLNVRDRNGLSILMFLLKNNQNDIIEIALSKGANPNLKDKFLLTPTLDACSLGKLESLKLLVKFGGDVNMKNKHSMNCEMLARFNKHIDILEYLKSIKNAKES